MARGHRLSTIASLAAAVRAVTAADAVPLSERAASIPRLVKAAAGGEYRGTGLGKIAAMGGAALYLLSPIDLLPEGLLGIFGLADDAMVASWLLTSLVSETEHFLTWEKQANSWVPGTTERGGRTSQGAGPQDR